MSALVEHPTNLTWDEFLALPYETRNASLIDGEVVVNSPNAQHERVVRNLLLVFAAWTRAAPGRGQASTQQPVKITDRRGYQPDFAWYPQDRFITERDTWRFAGVPGLIVEVSSPSTRAYDLVRKRDDYEQIGVDEVWFIEQDPSRYKVLACQRIDGGAFTSRELKPGDQLTSPLLDGFSVDVAELFRGD